MHPILFQIGNFSLRAYGLLIAIGTLVGFWVAWKKRKDANMTEDNMLDLLLILIVICFLGAKITYIATNTPLYYLQNPKDILSGSGLSFVGIVIFGFATCWFYAMKKKINFLALMDILMPGVMIGYSIGRIGCFLNGCCYGLPTSSVIGFHFSVRENFVRYPTQLFITGLALVFFFLLLYIYKKRKFHGVIMAWFLIFYSTISLVVGFYRDMLRFPPFNWTLNQYSIFIIVPVAICILIWGSKHEQIIKPEGKLDEGKVETWDQKKFDEESNEVIVNKEDNNV
jgi:phosphatidylglycerol:prolipoprotein diacylglycerol transferase